MPHNLPSPLGGDAPDEAPLSRAPLERVVMQVRFSSVLRIEQRDGIAVFQDQVRANYPLFEQITAQQLRIDLAGGPPGVPQVITTTAWQFEDAGRTLRLTLGAESATFEALKYEGRSDFLARWIEILARLQAIYSPGLSVRTGARYINRFHGEALAQLTELVKPNFVGVAQPELREHVSHALSEAALKVDEGHAMLRWGILEAGSTIDPNLLEQISVPSWILDIDVFAQEQTAFDVARLAETFEGLATRAYALFRYAMNDSALSYFGSAT
ncbi:TIGR04255 family protein [Phenylobacterium sp.]|uniref:TIGR04255 family protein n=1 Tax=Phenylobacterium sp. TaxID=1871053 RepID=UPI0035B4EE01